MAFQKFNQTKDGKAEVTEFLFDETLMTSDGLKVLSYPDYCEEWALFVLANRDMQREQPTHDYDIVYGPIADDGVVLQLTNYREGIYTPEQAAQLLQDKYLDQQYYFGTEQALRYLHKTNVEIV